jgi:cytochrome c oxidase subunit 4
MLRSTVTRALPRSSSLLARPAVCISTQQRFASAHAISNPTLADIEKRWEGMPPQEQAELWMALRDRMKANWSELTLQEKKAGMALYNPLTISIDIFRSQSDTGGKIEFCMTSRSANRASITAYYIAFGPHGPRALPPPGEGMKIFSYTIVGLLAAFALFAFTRSMAKPPPKTMTKEYQEMSNEYLKVRTPSTSPR